MKQRSRSSSAFSLAEVTLALGVAAFAFVAVLGMLPVGLKTQQAAGNQTKATEIIAAIFSDLRADVRLPPGQAQKETTQGLGLHGHWLALALPDTLYFTIEEQQTGGVSPATVPSDAVFRATITYIFPPTDTTSLANIKVTWPARVDPSTGVPAGSVQTFIAVNR